MLEREQTVVRQFSRVRMTKNTEHATIMFGITLGLHRGVEDMQQAFASPRKCESGDGCGTPVVTAKLLLLFDCRGGRGRRFRTQGVLAFARKINRLSKHPRSFLWRVKAR